MKPHLWLIRTLGVIVPRRLRADWRREWEAELRHREEMLSEWDKLDWPHKLDLLRRSLGAFRDTLLLQPQRWEDEMIQDLRYGVRMLLKNKGFTAVAALSLSLGIGANTAIFSLIDAAMLKVLPVEHPEQLVLFSRINPVGGGESFSYSQFEQFRDANQSFANVFGFAYRQSKVKVGNREEEALIQIASGQYFSALGVKPALGRMLSQANEHAQSISEESVAVISDSFWQRKFARDPAVIGKSITINGNPVNIIGVTPPGFWGVSLDYVVDVWLPLAMQPQLDGQSELNAAGRNLLRVMARLKPRVSVPQATANADLIFQQALRSINASPEALAQKIHLAAGGRPVSGMRQMISGPLVMLMVIVVLVLLIACANIANLLLARAAARQREISVRLALGASRFRLIRQLLTESILLALLGGAAGIFVGKWGSDLLLALTFNGFDLGMTPAPLSFHLDWRILGFTLLTSLVAGVLFGLAPAFSATRPDLISQLKDAAGNLSASGGRSKLNRMLVAVQLAASLVLIIAAGLFVRSFQKLANVELGFNPNVVQLQVTAPPNYTAAQRANAWNRMQDKLAAFPGVLTATGSLPGLFSHHNFYTIATTEGVAPRKPMGERDHDVVFSVAPGFFSTMGIPLLAGRDFGPQDHQHSASVTIINETMARRLFRDRTPIGQYVSIGGNTTQVVGVVKDAKYDSVLSAAPPMLYLPLEQFPPAQSSGVRFFEVRTSVDAASFAARLRQLAQSVDENLSVESLPLAGFVDRSLALQHMIARLTGLFGSLGLLLACVGVYGVMSYAVMQRTSEMGIRLALGAQRGDIIRLMLREAMLPVLGGVAIGLAVALGVTRLVGSQLFGLKATDPMTISLATLLMVAVAALAAYLPARKASRVDPMVTLRYE